METPAFPSQTIIPSSPNSDVHLYNDADYAVHCFLITRSTLRNSSGLLRTERRLQRASKTLAAGAFAATRLSSLIPSAIVATS